MDRKNLKCESAGMVDNGKEKAQEKEFVYEKPKIRTYDQISQVRPYGPSEK